MVAPVKNSRTSIARAQRQPHRLTIHSVTPPVILSFWTAQATELAQLAAEAERASNMAHAAHLWGLAAVTAPADAFTKSYCTEHAKVAA